MYQKITVLFKRSLLLAAVISAFYTAEVQAVEKPLIYFQTKSISGASRELKDVITSLADNLNLARFKLLKLQMAEHLDLAKMQLNGYAVGSPFKVAVTADLDKLRMIFKKKSDTAMQAEEGFEAVRFTFLVPLSDKELFRKHLASLNDDAKIPEDQWQEGEVYFKLTDSAFLVSNTKAPLDVDSVIGQIDDANDYQVKDLSALVRFKVHPENLEEMYQENLYKGFLDNIPQITQNPMLQQQIPQPDAGMLRFALELYGEFSNQANKLSPRMLGGYFKTKATDEHFDIELHMAGDYENRDFLKNYHTLRSYQIESLHQRGQVPLSDEEALVHITFPFPMKDFITTMQNQKATSLFLIRDLYEALFIITDVFTVMDTREDVWKNFNQGFDVIVFDVPQLPMLKNINSYAFAIMADLEKGHGVNKLLDRIVEISAADPDGLKKEGKLYYTGIAESRIYFGASEHLFFVCNRKDKAQKLLDSKPQGWHRRASMSFKGESDNDNSIDYPVGFSIDLDGLRKKVFSGQMAILQHSSTFLPQLKGVKLYFNDRRSNDRVNSRFKLRMIYNKKKAGGI